ncbi:MAG: LysR family transcriptional regulator, partial [Clostridia bacterium]|nr:LysR family transcriptional regulator [Clostridia bacterium]
RSLEREVSFKLLVLTRSGVRLTPEGEQIYPFLQRIVSAKRELAGKVNELNGLESGEVRIGVFSSLSQHVLPGLMKAFGDLYPGIQFVLYQGDNKTMPDWLKSGLIDFAFMYPSAATDLKTDVVAQEQCLAVLPAGHPLAAHQEIPLRALAKEPLILVEEGGSVNTALEAFEKARLTPNIRFRIQDDATILAMIEEGFGVSILSDMTLAHSAHKVVARPTVPKVERTLTVAYPDPVFLPIAAKRFLNYMYEHLPDYMTGTFVRPGTPKSIK